jgi:hypothetical protein
LAKGGASHLIAESDEKRGHVLAVTVNLRKRRAGALRREAPRGELEKDAIRFGFGTLDVTPGSGLLDLDVFDRVAADVVVPAQKRSRAEQAAQRAVVQRGDRFGEGSWQRWVRTPTGVASRYLDVL